MKNHFLIGGVVVLCIALGLFVYASLGFDTSEVPTSETAGSVPGETQAQSAEPSAAKPVQKKEPQAAGVDVDAAMRTAVKAGSYELYAADKLTKANSGDVVLFFRASWCHTCRDVDADIRAYLPQIPAGLTILDLDYDNSGSLKQKYGVTYQHTFVQVDGAGNLIKKWSGSPTLAAIVKQVQ